VVGERYYFVFVGTAGSGKTTLVKALSEWLESIDVASCKVNLDPAVEWIPYAPDVDVREYVDARKVAEEYQLGPNGALVVSVDLLYNHAHEIKSEIAECGAKYVLIDTPGQLELFAYRNTSLEVLRRIVNPAATATAFLIDGIFASQASSLASLLLLSLSVRLRLGFPQVTVVSKSDLLPPEVLELVSEVSESADALLELLGAERGAYADLARRVFEAVADEGFKLLPVSAHNPNSLWALFEELQRAVGAEEELHEQEAP